MTIFKYIFAVGLVALSVFVRQPNITAASPSSMTVSDGVVYAQGQSMQGGENSLILFTKEDVNGVPENPITCPAGWTEVVYGYGPHYIAMISYDWIGGGGWAPGWWFPPPPTGGGIPGGGPPPPPPDEPEPSDPPPPPVGEGPDTPGGGPPIPGEEDEDGFPLPLKDRESQGGDGGEPWSNGADGRGGNEPGSPPGGMLGSGKSFAFKDFIFEFIKVATAQVPYTYTVNDVAIGSTSICSYNSLVVIDEKNLYLNTFFGNLVSTTHTFADACSGNECNRCRICVK